MSNNVRATYHSYPLVIIILVLNIVGEVKQHLSPQRKRKEGEILKWGYYEKSRWTNTVCGGQQCAQSDQQRLLLVHSHCILLVEPSKRSPTPATTSSRWHFGSQWAIPLAVKQWGRWMKKKKKEESCGLLLVDRRRHDYWNFFFCLASDFKKSVSCAAAPR